MKKFQDYLESAKTYTEASLGRVEMPQLEIPEELLDAKNSGSTEVKSIFNKISEIIKQLDKTRGASPFSSDFEIVIQKAFELGKAVQKEAMRVGK